MAISTEGLLGDFRGRIGNVIVYKMYGKTVMRSMPTKKRKPATGKLKQNQQEFARVMKYMQAINKFIKQGFADVAENRSKFHTALSYNKKRYTKTCETERPEWLLLSYGKRAGAMDISVEKESEGQAVLIWGDPEDEKTYADNDRVMVLALNTTTMREEHNLNAAFRKDGQCSLMLPPGENGDKIDIYMAFRVQEGSTNKYNIKNISNSQWAGRIVL